MKIFKTDISAKYINFEMDGENYSVTFKNSILKGIHNVSVWKGGTVLELQKVKIRSTYPSLARVVKEIALLISLRSKAVRTPRNPKS